MDAVAWSVGAYALDRLEPMDDGVLTTAKLWEDYMAWCARGDKVPMAQAIFLERFEILAREIGIKRRQRDGHVMFEDVGFQKDAG
jgi:hypothetical protein